MAIELFIMSAEQALRHVPKVPTAVMRIRSGERKPNEFHRPLYQNGNFIRTFKYIFDDTNPKEHRELRRKGFARNVVLFDEKNAEEIINNFVSVKDRIQALLIHCYRGLNRAP